MTSPDGRYNLQLQNDGNLVVYRNDGVPIWASGPDTTVPDPPDPPDNVTLPMLRARSTQLVNQDTDQLWKWRGVSAFKLFDQYRQGQDILTYCDWAQRHGFNILRVFGMYCGGLGRLVPYAVPGYFEKLASFLTEVGKFGLSVEWVAFADMQTPELSRVDIQQHYASLMDVLLGRPGVVLEVCNEPFKNGLAPTDVYAPFSELAQALGLYIPENNQLPHAQYLTVHTPRDEEWCRKAKDVLELTRMGWDGFEPLRIPGVADEPMGIGVDQPGRRSMNPHDHAAYHATAAMFGSGSTVHGDFAIDCRLPNADEQAVVDAITQTWTVVPPEAQIWIYTAGHLGSCPLENQGLRVYGMIGGRRAICVLIRPTGPPVARDGWQIMSQQGYGGIVVELVR